MRLSNIIRKLKDSDAFSYLLINNPKMIFISGSHSQGILDERSDLDLAVIVDDHTKEQDYALIYDDSLYIHWTFKDESFLDGTWKSDKLLDLVGGAQLHNIGEDNIIYTRDGYDKEAAILKARESSRSYMYRFIDEMKSSIEMYISEGIDLHKNKTKLLYHLCWISHIIEGTDINIEYCAKLKRIKYEEVEDNVKKYCIDRLKYLIEL